MTTAAHVEVADNPNEITLKDVDTDFMVSGNCISGLIVKWNKMVDTETEEVRCVKLQLIQIHPNGSKSDMIMNALFYDRWKALIHVYSKPKFRNKPCSGTLQNSPDALYSSFCSAAKNKQIFD